MKGIKDVLTKERLDTIANNVKKGSDYVIPTLRVVLFGIAAINSLEPIRYAFGKVKYDDAVDAIMKSSMMSADKAKAVTLLRKDDTSESYKAVIRVVKSSMWSSDKIKTIQNLCQNDNR